MSQYYGAPPNQYAGGSAANLQFYPSSYSPGVPSQAASSQSYSYGAPTPGPSGYGGFGAAPGVSGRMGEQGGLRTGWIAAFSTEGYDGEPPLLEELGVNFGHIQMKVSVPITDNASRTHTATMLTNDVSDFGSSQPLRTYRSAHHGRLRLGRSDNFLSPIRHISAPQRKGTLRLHLRISTYGVYCATHNFVPYVSRRPRLA